MEKRNFLPALQTADNERKYCSKLDVEISTRPQNRSEKNVISYKLRVTIHSILLLPLCSCHTFHLFSEYCDFCDLLRKIRKIQEL